MTAIQYPPGGPATGASTAAKADLDLLSGAVATGIATDLPVTKKIALAAVDSGGGVFSWAAPYDAVVIRVVVVTTHVSNAACTLDVGSTTVSGTTSSANIIDGADLTTTAPATFTTDTVALDGSQDCQYVPSGNWVTGSVASGASAGLTGSVYITYHKA